MKYMLQSLCFAIEALLSKDDGQDLVEYALLACLIALGACAGMSNLAAAVSSSFSNVTATIAAEM